jgi:hypothetical protein
MMNSVPFTIEQLMCGFAQAHGLIHDDGDAVRIEFQIVDKILKSIKSKVDKVRLPLDQLESVSLEKSWLGTKIIVQAKRLELVEKIPGATGGRIELKIARKDRSLAAKFVEELHEYEEEPVAQ